MDSGESPVVARRRVRLALRAAREAKGFTQGHVAQELDWSLSKVNRIEKGDVTVSRTDLLAMLEMYGVADSTQVDDLVQAARTSRQRGWWDVPRYREHMTNAMLQLLQFESEASAIRFFAPTLIPGILQTPAYTDFVLDFWKDEMPDPATREIRREARTRRREQVIEGAHPPQYFLILDESVLYREIGGPMVAGRQLLDLLTVVDKKRLIVRVLRFADAAHLAMLGQFTILDLGDEENAVLYRETIPSDEIHSDARVGRYRQRFEQMWTKAMSPEASARLIRARAATMLSAADMREAYSSPS
jgi:transcriptional regulator with XRE-family HTH domain